MIEKIIELKVKGINIVKKHVKTTKEKKGGIISKENFIHISNLKILDGKKKKKLRLKNNATKIKRFNIKEIQPI